MLGEHTFAGVQRSSKVLGMWQRYMHSDSCILTCYSCWCHMLGGRC
jgi:hypothetical protein